MVSADVRTYVGPGGDEVEVSPHEYVTQYKSRGYVLKRDMVAEGVDNPDVDSSELEAPAVNAAIETKPSDLEAARHGEKRRDRLRD